MAWYFEIRDPQGELVKRVGGFRTTDEAMEQGIIERDRLAKRGVIPGSGFVTVATGQDSTEPWR